MRTPAFTALSEITGAKSESELPALIPAFFVIAVCFWSQFFAGFGRLGVGICRSLLRFLLLPGREVGGSARFPPLLFVPALTGRALAPGRCFAGSDRWERAAVMITKPWAVAARPGRPRLRLGWRPGGRFKRRLSNGALPGRGTPGAMHAPLGYE